MPGALAWLRLSARPSDRAIGRIGLTLIVVVHFALGWLYNVSNPLFEAPDEIWHTLYVRHVADGRGLPVQDERHRDLFGQQEAGQPPLYYALAGALTGWIPRGDIRDVARENPVASVGDVASEGNKNRFVHGSIEAWPWRGEVLAARLARLLATFFGAVTVLLTYLIARHLWPDRLDLAIGAAGVNALIPQFLFIGAAVNNDVPAAAFSSFVLLLSLRLAALGPSPARLAVVGIAVGLATLTKLSALASIALPIAALAWWHARALRQARGEHPSAQQRPAILSPSGERSGAQSVGRLFLNRLEEPTASGPFSRSWRVLPSLVASSLIVVATAALVSGWWFARNVAVYGEPVPLRSFLGRVALDDEVPTVAQIIADLPGLTMSFWALFGWFSVLADARVYAYYDGLMVAAGIGLVVAAMRRWRGECLLPPGLWLVALWLVVIVGALLRYRLIVQAFQGRLLFPAVSAIAILLYLGIASLLPRRLVWLGPVLVLGPMVVIALALPIRTIAPAYASPPVGPVEVIGPPNHRIGATLGGTIELLGYDQSTDFVRPGESVEVALYWHALVAMTEDFVVFVHVLDPTGALLAQRDSFPGRGNRATSLWSPGEVLRDPVRVAIPATTAVPVRVRIVVGAYPASTRTRLPVTSGDDRASGDTIPLGTLRIGPPPAVVFETARADVFDSTIELIGYTMDTMTVTPGDAVAGRLGLRSLRPTDRDYTVFVHLVRDGALVAQVDQQPYGSRYPTSAWRPGDEHAPPFRLELPPNAPSGRYRLLMGLYHLPDGQRLRTATADHVSLTDVTVAR